MKNDNSYCNDWARFPQNTEGSFGAFVNGRAVVCGGEHPERKVFSIILKDNDCFHFHFQAAYFFMFFF